MSERLTEEQRLRAFADELYQDVLVRAETAGGEEYLENEFTRSMLETLTLAGEIDDEWDVAFHQARGMKVNGFGINADQDTLCLFYTDFTGERPPKPVSPSEVDTGFRRLRTFLAKALKGELHQLEESSPGFALIDQIGAWRPRLERARLYFLTDGLTSVDTLKEETLDGLAVAYHVWDLRRTYRCLSSGQQREPIDIDFSKHPGGALPCLAMPGSSDEYSAYLLMIPGEVLAAIYDMYGTRLLERNVRAFLQARGKVNKGIRETILHSPHRFLAYNNGITATAAEVTVIKRRDGTPGIARARDFQIVNGGQTTASIYHAVRRDKADVSAVSVPAKLSVVEPAKLDELVPVISRYANTQNKVSEADFWANDPFHVALEEISRTVWTPPARGQQRQTRWFYERARGQYADALGRETTPARKRQFQAMHPPRQRFTKTDLAKFENTWYQQPHFVARGAEKNFREFAIRVKERNLAAHEDYFRNVVARAILFREAERVVSGMEFGGYRSQIVTYSIAYLSHATAMQLDLDEIWKTQTLPQAVREALTRIASVVHESITHPPGGQNIAEWCKKEDCWDTVRALDIRLPDDLGAGPAQSGVRRVKGDSGRVLSEQEEREVQEMAAVPAEVWFALAGWAKETNNLQGWQRRIAYGLGQLAARGRPPSAKQARQGAIMLEEARRLGFRDELAVTAAR